MALTGTAGCVGSLSAGNENGTDATTDRTGTAAQVDAPSFAAWAHATPHESLGTVSLAPAGEGPAVYVGSAAPDDASSGSTDSSGDHALHALTLREGRERWRTALDHPVRTPPTYGGDDGPERLYFATGPRSLHGRDAKLQAVDPAGGDRAWTFDTEDRRFVYPLATTDDAVFAGRRDDQIGRQGEYVYALDAADGEERWRTESGDADREGSATFRDTLFVQAYGRLRALDPATGAERWLVEGNRTLDGPAFGNQGKRVFVGADGTVRGLRIDDGSEAWRREFEFTVSGVTTPRAAAGTTLYVGDYDGRLLALDPLSGETRWTLSVDGDQFSPVVRRTSESLFVGGAGVHAVDPVSGDERWSFAPDGAGRLGVQASTTAFAFDAKRDRLYALDPATGEERWRFAPGAPIVGPATAGDVAFVGVGGTVYGLDGSASG